MHMINVWFELADGKRETVMCKQVEEVEDEDDGEKIWKIFPFAEL